MIRYTALMVAIDHGENDEEIYISIDVIDDRIKYPENTPQEIRRLVLLCSEMIDDESISIIDCFGIIKDRRLELWENVDHEIEEAFA